MIKWNVIWFQSQAEHTECQIKLEFEKLHQFLRDEEQIAITALREEQEQKNQMMQEKFAEINRHISALSHTIRDLEKMLNANEVLFLKVSVQIIDSFIDHRFSYWLFKEIIVCLFSRTFQTRWKGEWSVRVCGSEHVTNPMQFWLLNVLPESRAYGRIHSWLLELWLMWHITWATCRSEPGRRCKTSSKTVSL